VIGWSRREIGLGTVAALAALTAAGRLLFSWWPNVSPAYFLVFAVGVAFGPRAGASVGALAMAATDVLLSGFLPESFVNLPAMAFLGFVGGLLGAVVDFGQRSDVPRPLASALAGFVGVAAVILFSIASDTLSFAFFLLPSGAGWAAYRGLILAGLAFNVVPAAIVGCLFAWMLFPTLRAARLANLTAPMVPPVPEPRPQPATRGPLFGSYP
jgi:hypothetical protein